MSQVADAMERHKASLALDDRLETMITQLWADLETSWERQKKASTLAARAKAETARLRDDHASMVVVLVQEWADLHTRGEKLDKAQEELQALKLVLADQEGDMLRTQVDLNKQEAELVSLRNQLKEAQEELVVHQ